MKRNIKKLLCAMPLGDEHKAVIEARLPGTQVVYTSYNKTNETAVDGVDVIFGNVKPQFLVGANDIKWIQLGSAGADEYLTAIRNGLLVTNATGGYGETISEHILAMLLMLQKKMHIYHTNMLSGTWKKAGEVRGIYGSTTLILGMGDIGGRFGEKMKLLGAYVIGVRRCDMNKPDYCDELYTMDHIDELIPRADSIVMALPNTPQTVGIMNWDRMNLMKHDAVLINVGRGSAVVQDDLIKALNSDRIWGAGLDVASPEPLPPDHPLWSAKNLIITPHTSGGWTLPKNTEDVLKIFLDNLDIWESGGEPFNQVDPNTGYAKKR